MYHPPFVCQTKNDIGGIIRRRWWTGIILGKADRYLNSRLYEPCPHNNERMHRKLCSINHTFARRAEGLTVREGICTKGITLGFGALISAQKRQLCAFEFPTCAVMPQYRWHLADLSP